MYKTYREDDKTTKGIAIAGTAAIIIGSYFFVWSDYFAFRKAEKTGEPWKISTKVKRLRLSPIEKIIHQADVSGDRKLDDFEMFKMFNDLGCDFVPVARFIGYKRAELSFRIADVKECDYIGGFKYVEGKPKWSYTFTVPYDKMWQYSRGHKDWRKTKMTNNATRAIATIAAAYIIASPAEAYSAMPQKEQNDSYKIIKTAEQIEESIKGLEIRLYGYSIPSKHDDSPWQMSTEYPATIRKDLFDVKYNSSRGSEFKKSQLRKPRTNTRRIFARTHSK